MVAIPDAFFKIVVREGDGDAPDVLVFNYPQRGLGCKVKKPATYNHLPQGQRTLSAFSGKDLHQEIDTPAGHATLHDAAMLARMLPD